MVRTENLTFKYHQKETVFQFPDIDLNQTENLLILGKSGIGKTTLLHLMAGLLKPSSGTVTITDVNLQSLNSKQLDKFIGENIGLVFQKNYAVRSLNVMENIQARLFFCKKKVDHSAITNLLQQLNIESCKSKKINELSEGQLQRLGIALSVIHEPKLILADEPTASLDDENCQAVMSLLLDQAKKNKANLVVITHDQRVKPLFQNILEL
ncbi:ABC transporter ATP-binding protein [Hanstruepera flava]|uniref:ABC transporter ATP-binding protein n=1 Tax=Hanstruepera flava TaxID=2930218 RepID=UPI002028CC71|nr:ATP-binding cassette domain-containing protein [Hanstruepera flava]